MNDNKVWNFRQQWIKQSFNQFNFLFFLLDFMLNQDITIYTSINTIFIQY